MRFIHIADVHLGVVPDKGYPWSQTRAEEIWRTFREAVQMAEREQVDLLLIAGDLFHKQPGIRELKEVNYLLGGLTKTQVVMIAGNHDYLKQDSPYERFSWEENICFLKSRQCGYVRFPELNTQVYGLSYYGREIREPMYDEVYPENLPGCHILLAHGGDETHIPINWRKLSGAGFDYVALGHIHKPQYLEEDRMAYAGSLEPLDINDTGPHGLIMGEYENGKLQTKFVPFARREYIHEKLYSDGKTTDLAMEEQVEQLIRRRGPENFYRITICGYRDPEIVFRTKSYEGLGNILEIRDTTEPDFDFEELLRIHGDDVVGRYIRRLLEESKKQGRSGAAGRALYEGVAALLHPR